MEGYQVNIVFGAIDKFRKGVTEIMVTTDLLSRNFDMHSIQLVINFDVPLADKQPDHETYMYRIRKAGHYGGRTHGVAVTIFDREEDETAFWKIVEHYKMQDKVIKLESAAKIGELMDEINKL